MTCDLWLVSHLGSQVLKVMDDEVHALQWCALESGQRVLACTACRCAVLQNRRRQRGKGRAGFVLFPRCRLQGRRRHRELSVQGRQLIASGLGLQCSRQETFNPPPDSQADLQVANLPSTSLVIACLLVIVYFI